MQVLDAAHLPKPGQDSSASLVKTRKGEGGGVNEWANEACLQLYFVFANAVNQNAMHQSVPGHFCLLLVGLVPGF